MFLLIGFGAVAPLDLTPLGYTGCTAYPANFFSINNGFLSASGVSPLSLIPVPNDPSLVFLQTNFQAAAVNVTTLNLEFSDVVIATLGK